MECVAQRTMEVNSSSNPQDYPQAFVPLFQIFFSLQNLVRKPELVPCWWKRGIREKKKKNECFCVTSLRGAALGAQHVFASTTSSIHAHIVCDWSFLK